MTLAKLAFQPGFHKESTQLAAGPAWYNGDKVRFRKGRVESIGGWEKYTSESYLGVARSLHDWGTAAAAKWLGIGTTVKFYVELGGSITDITPIRETTAGGDVRFVATEASSVLTVTDTSHGAVQGDYVTYTLAVGLGGNIITAVLNQEYEIKSIVDANSYTIFAYDASGFVFATAADTPGGGGSDGGAATVGAYQINTGTDAYVASTGYGVGPYGGGAYGGGGSLLFSGQLRLYSQDEFGDDLIINPRAGGVYFWDESEGITPERAVALSDMAGESNAPTVAFQTMVSQVDRHVICFGVNSLGESELDPLLIRWSDRENALDWTPTAINSAGGQVLSSGTEIIGAIKTRHEKLIFTDSSIHSMTYVGAPFVYQFAVVGENTTILSPKAAVVAGDSVFFMDLEGFYMYKGSVQRLPCSVLDFVFSDVAGEGLDTSQVYKTFATTNTNHSEVTWFYPSIVSPSGGGRTSPIAEVNRYVTYNYAENVWTTGLMDRGSWIPAPTKTFPVAAGVTAGSPSINYLYNQEFGYNRDGLAMDAYVLSGNIPIGDGDRLEFIKRFIPDFKIKGESANANFSVTMYGSDFPMEGTTSTSAATVMSDTKQSHIRLRCREFSMGVVMSGLDYGWSMGDFRFDMRTDGKR
jgi:hypothetical protein